MLAIASAVVAGAGCRSDARRGTLPSQLTDEQFWRLSTGVSEPPGVFTASDNLVSNETQYPHLIRMLDPMGGVYIGVGPEQNFSYMARLRPVMAFIIDVRQENRNLHLMYKALFELSADRADFVSRLFSRERPAGLDHETSVQALFAGFETARPDSRLYDETARMVRDRLIAVHRLSLSADDLGSIEAALARFRSEGPTFTTTVRTRAARPIPPIARS